MAKGRKRKSGKRHPCGKLVRASTGETQADVLATVVEARRRQYGVTARQARDERLGSALGRLAFRGLITTDQYSAGQVYATTMGRYRAIMGMPTDQPRSMMALLINEGIFASGDVVHAPDLIEKVRRQAAAVQLILRSCGCAPGCDGGRAAINLVHRVVISDEDASNWPAADMGNLVQGLEALRKLFHIQTDGSRSV
jgi:hypothetical protein